MPSFKLCRKCETKKLSLKFGRLEKKKRSKSYSRSKGHDFERWCAVQFRKLFPDARRQLEYHADDAKGVDLQGTAPYLVQCKAYNQYAPITCLTEIQVCPIEGGIPVLVTKGDSLPPVAVLSLEDFLSLVRDAKRGRR